MLVWEDEVTPTPSRRHCSNYRASPSTADARADARDVSDSAICTLAGARSVARRAADAPRVQPRAASTRPTSASSTARPTSTSWCRSSTSGRGRSTSPPAPTTGCRRRSTCRATSRLWKDPERPDRRRAPHHQAQPRLLRHRRFAGRQQHRAGHLPPHHGAGVPPVPAAPGVRGGDPHARLPVHRRVARAWTRARSSTPTTRSSRSATRTSS